MWITLIATAVAASVLLSVVNLASQINQVRNARLSIVVEFTPRNTPLPDRGLTTIIPQNNHEDVDSDPGA